MNNDLSSALQEPSALLLYFYGVSSGLYVTAVLVLFLYGLTYFNKNHDWRIVVAFVLAAVAFACFGFYHLFYQQVHKAITIQVLPAWVFYLGKMFAPISLIALTFIYTRALRIRSYAAYSINMRFLWVEYGLYAFHVGLFIALIWLDNLKLASLLVLVSYVITITIASYFSYRSIGGNAVGRLLTILLTVVSFITLLLFLISFSDRVYTHEPLMVGAHLFFGCIMVACAMILIRFGFSGMRRVFNLQALDEMQLLHEINPSLLSNDFVIHYQPQINLKDNSLHGVEALIRWQHPKKGLIMPERFIALAEQSGLIEGVTKWVINTVLKDCRRLLDNGLAVSFAINISADSLNEQMASYLAERLEYFAVPASLINIEIPEGLAMYENQEQVRDAILLFGRRMGLAVDRYGTGYSSLSYFKKIAINQIKIDRSFIFDLDTAKDNQAIVFSTVQMTKNLKLTLVAVGVESEAALSKLKEFGCDVAQGFVIARAMPFGELCAWMDSSPFGLGTAMQVRS